MIDTIKIPAIRSRMGIWIYYTTSLSFKEVQKYINNSNDDLFSVNTIINNTKDMNYYKSIANYLETQEERFFNALILAVYDGEPTWNEIRIDMDGIDNYNLGVLTLNGKEKIFPVDGQHRVAGIKKALDDNADLENERVPVVFVGHSKDEVGMQRTRRMFSTLNRYAKPVSLRDIIALDEDDIVAIASRNIIDYTDVFSEGKILDVKTKAIPDGNNTALTSIITYYDCNKELLWLLVKDIVVVGLDGKAIAGHKKINEYIRHRPDDETIELFTEECKKFWEAINDSCKEAMNADDGTIGRYRDKNGGHLFFRPVSLLPFAKMVVRIREGNNVSYAEIIEGIPEPIRWIQHKLWRRIVWDRDKRSMITGNSKLIELLLLYIYDKRILKDGEIKKIRNELISIWDYHEDDIMEVLDSIIHEED